MTDLLKRIGLLCCSTEMQRFALFTRATTLLAAALALTACAGSALPTIAPAAPAASPVTATSSASSTGVIRDYPLYELRTYTTNEGKLDALQARFRNHTMALFEKHGAKNIAYWTPTEQPNTLIYIIAHKSNDAKNATWKSFLEDPDWRAVYATSIANGKLVTNIDSVLMSATDYSPNF